MLIKKREEFVIQFCEEIIKNPPTGLEKSRLWDVYHDLANIFYSRWNTEKWNEYYTKAEELWYEYTNY